MLRKKYLEFNYHWGWNSHNVIANSIIEASHVWKLAELSYGKSAPRIHQVWIITILHVHFDSAIQRQTFTVTAAYSPRLFYSWTVLWSIIHTKLILCWSPQAQRLRHRINYIIDTSKIIVYDSVKQRGISLCVITSVASPAIIFIIVANIVNVIVFLLQDFSGAYF